MQTFLPLPSFYESACVLDRQRLGNQRVEVMQILNTLLGVKQGWVNHPTIKMWRGFEFSLAEYGVAVCQEWKKRGYKDNIEVFFLNTMYDLRMRDFYKDKPTWFGSEKFHLSHKSNLIRKFPNYYQSLWPDCPNDLPYVWPV